MFGNIYYGWWIVTACFLINLLVGGTTFFGFTAFFEPIQREFNWSYTQISLATSLRGLEMGLFAPVVGILVDRFGSRKLLLGGMVVIGIGLVCLNFTQSLFMFYLSILLISFGAGGCTTVVTMTAVAMWFKKRIGLALGIMACGFGIGGFIVPLIVFLIDAYGWRPTLVILGVGVWVLGIPLSLIVRDRPEDLGLHADGAAESSKTPERKNGLGKTKEVFFAVVKQRSFWYLAISETMRFMAVNAVFTHIMPYLSSIGMPRTSAGIVAAALPLTSIAGRLGFGWWGDRSEKRVVWGATFFMTGAGILAFNYVHAFWALLLFVLLFGPAFGGGAVLRGAMVQRYFGMAAFGTMLGILFGFGSLGGIIGPTLAGWTFDTLGSYAAIWYVLSAVCAASLFLVLKIRPVISEETE